MQSQYGGQGMNDLVNKESGGADEGQKNPFDQFEKDMIKGQSNDPITSELLKYIDKELTVK
jgi:hypothetical protein